MGSGKNETVAGHMEGSASLPVVLIGTGGSMQPNVRACARSAVGFGSSEKVSKGRDS